MFYKYDDQKPVVELNLARGSYIFELWGAQGGQGCTDQKKLTQYYGGRGAFVVGKVQFRYPQRLYLFLGGKGGEPTQCSTKYNGKGGFNGGSDGGYELRDDDPPGGGGGATDIRLINGTSNKSLYSHIIVAAGGSGSSWNTYGAPGGDLTGYVPKTGESKIFEKSDTNQTHGYSLGLGETGINTNVIPTSGAGGGYYGGKTGKLNPDLYYSVLYQSVSSSGSSYISGYKGCNSVDENGIHTNSPNHYSGIVFFDIVRCSMVTNNSSVQKMKLKKVTLEMVPFELHHFLIFFSCNQFIYFNIQFLLNLFNIFLIS
ncbi:hypothetical protein TVAG_043320 [Trichomonas vaginalis G3]|uniref:receptor protein-tyrosine kinase n=1 Tax=Trichomonas vaginalis (strain ATCC PRA-98 / G3) TaxID=412133 RepID=A2G3Q4_TRIV3|nr:hypothetical protein TVAG_043320 [Trichomonas vaginalis G3]|eukprot:XP_001301146.1 hypothetical protein [Trichomonas vaginalis G3]